jgi:hypothetical protein
MDPTPHYPTPEEALRLGPLLGILQDKAEAEELQYNIFMELRRWSPLALRRVFLRLRADPRDWLVLTGEDGRHRNPTADELERARRIRLTRAECGRRARLCREVAERLSEAVRGLRYCVSPVPPAAPLAPSREMLLRELQNTRTAEVAERKRRKAGEVPKTVRLPAPGRPRAPEETEDDKTPPAAPDREPAEIVIDETAAAEEAALLARLEKHPEARVRGIVRAVLDGKTLDEAGEPYGLDHTQVTRLLRKAARPPRK